ncbi:MAG TPA: ECF-type sigma factor [Pirellulales bacterium]|nr:ECF-type sigma factor [Pirellulales bacterium]
MSDGGQSGCGELTALLNRASAGEVDAQDAAYRLVEGELREIVHARLRNCRRHEQTTLLVNDTFLKLVKRGLITWECRAKFLRLGYRAVWDLHVDWMRREHAAKRGGGNIARLSADFATLIDGRQPLEPAELLALNEALEKLGQRDAEAREIVQLLYLGHRQEEAAEVLGLSLATVERRWRMARGFLQRELGA